MELHNLKPNPGAKHRTKRLGSGESSGLGKTSGKGNKGQKARSGSGTRVGFEGGQMPLHRRLPKRGFNNFDFRDVFIVVNVGDLDDRFESGALINEKSSARRVLSTAHVIKSSFSAMARLRRLSPSASTRSARPPARRSRRPAAASPNLPRRPAPP